MENVLNQPINAKELRSLIRDVALIKNVLLNEDGELTDWAKKELAEARRIPNSENVSLEEVEKMIIER